MSAFAYALVAVAAVAFYELFLRLRVLGDVQRVFRVAPDALHIIGSDTLTDNAKESAIRKLSLRVLTDTLRFTGKMLVAVAISAALVWAGALALGLSTESLVSLLLSWRVLIGLIVLIALYARLSTRLRDKPQARQTPPDSSVGRAPLDV